MDPHFFYYAGLALCLPLSFLLSGMEAGVFALNRLRVRRLARSGKRSAQLLHGFLERPERFLWTILVGNTLANFLILGWLLVKLHEWFFGRTMVIIAVFAGIVFVFYVLFDLLPKMLFRAHANQLCLSFAQFFRVINFILGPLALVVEEASKIILYFSSGKTFTGRLFGNREEMRALMQESSQSLSTDERMMINRVLDLQNYTVGQIARPLAQTVTVSPQMTLREALNLAREKNLSRLPVWEDRGGVKRIGGLLAIGPLLFRDDLNLDRMAAAYMIPAIFVAENVRLEVALRLMQRSGHRLAIALAHDNREIGILSLEDILKVMFGEVKL